MFEKSWLGDIPKIFYIYQMGPKMIQHMDTSPTKTGDTTKQHDPENEMVDIWCLKKQLWMIYPPSHHTEKWTVLPRNMSSFLRSTSGVMTNQGHILYIAPSLLFLTPSQQPSCAKAIHSMPLETLGCWVHLEVHRRFAQCEPTDSMSADSPATHSTKICGWSSACPPPEHKWVCQ